MHVQIYITVNITEGHGQQKIWITGMLFFIVDYFLKCILFFWGFTPFLFIN